MLVARVPLQIDELQGLDARGVALMVASIEDHADSFRRSLRRR
jgi:hypothetical protein